MINKLRSAVQLDLTVQSALPAGDHGRLVCHQPCNVLHHHLSTTPVSHQSSLIAHRSFHCYSYVIIFDINQLHIQLIHVKRSFTFLIKTRCKRFQCFSYIY